jgi:hypothetical protein
MLKHGRSIKSFKIKQRRTKTNQIILIITNQLNISKQNKEEATNKSSNVNHNQPTKHFKTKQNKYNLSVFSDRRVTFLTYAIFK